MTIIHRFLFICLLHCSFYHRVLAQKKNEVETKGMRGTKFLFFFCGGWMGGVQKRYTMLFLVQIIFTLFTLIIICYNLGIIFTVFMIVTFMPFWLIILPHTCIIFSTTLCSGTPWIHWDSLIQQWQCCRPCFCSRGNSILQSLCSVWTWFISLSWWLRNNEETSSEEMLWSYLYMWMLLYYC